WLSASCLPTSEGILWLPSLNGSSTSRPATTSAATTSRRTKRAAQLARRGSGSQPSGPYSSAGCGANGSGAGTGTGYWTVVGSGAGEATAPIGAGAGGSWPITLVGSVAGEPAVAAAERAPTSGNGSGRGSWLAAAMS